MKLIKKITDRIKYQIFKSRDYDSEKIFLIGLSKTGTTSICDALEILGYKSIHFPPLVKQVKSGITFSWPWYLERYEAFGDIPVSFFYQKLDKLYPNAKFILSYREKDKWLDSAKKHFSVPSRDQHVAELHKKLYGADLYDHTLFGNSFEKYHEDVINYFENRKNFLLIDIFTEIDPWDKLSYFLNKEKPKTLFPKSNSRHPFSSDEIKSFVKCMKLPDNFTSEDVSISLDLNGISKKDIDPELLFLLISQREPGHPNVMGYYKEVIHRKCCA